MGRNKETQDRDTQQMKSLYYIDMTKIFGAKVSELSSSPTVPHIRLLCSGGPISMMDVTTLIKKTLVSCGYLDSGYPLLSDIIDDAIKRRYQGLNEDGFLVDARIESYDYPVACHDDARLDSEGNRIALSDDKIVNGGEYVPDTILIRIRAADDRAARYDPSGSLLRKELGDLETLGNYCWRIGL